MQWLSLMLILLLSLAEDDLHDVYIAVVDVTTSYYKLGIGLGLPSIELDKIHKGFPYDVDQAFTEVLLVWLRHRYNVEKHGPPTWCRLVEAVDSPAGGNNHELAKNIACQHLVSGSVANAPVQHTFVGDVTAHLAPSTLSKLTGVMYMLRAPQTFPYLCF